MKILFYSGLSLFFSILALICLEESLFDSYSSSLQWDSEYESWIRLFSYFWALFFAIVTYFVILRCYAAKRRKVMKSKYGRTDCSVIADFTEAQKMLERANYGIVNSAPAVIPPPLSSNASPDQTVDVIRAKLNSLQQMKNEGLITEEECTNKKAELLKQL